MSAAGSGRVAHRPVGRRHESAASRHMGRSHARHRRAWTTRWWRRTRSTWSTAFRSKTTCGSWRHVGVGRLCLGSVIGGGLHCTNRAADEKVQACSAHQLCCTSDSAPLPCRTRKTPWASRRPWTERCWWPSTRRAVRLELGGLATATAAADWGSAWGPSSSCSASAAIATPSLPAQPACHPPADLLMNAFGLSEDAALVAISLGVDFGVTQLVRAGCAAGCGLLVLGWLHRRLFKLRRVMQSWEPTHHAAAVP